MNNPREELVSFLRGFFACPVVSFLGRHGFTERLLAGGLRLDDSHSDALAAVLRYLVALELLEETETRCFRATALGEKVLKRFGAFCLIDSYGDYFHDLDWILPSSSLPRPKVNRELNIIGSGQFHARKFFPDVYAHLASTQYDHLTDIGCGDGTFLQQATLVRPGLSVTAVDLSEQAIGLVRQRLSEHLPLQKYSCVVCDGFDVDQWAQAVLAPPRTRQLITLWFLLHEISNGSVERLVFFLKQIHAHFPTATIAFAELCRLSPEELVSHRHTSIMPEYLLFHELSGQHILREDELSKLITSVPYRLICRREFDPILYNSKLLPSSILCILAPKKSGENDLSEQFLSPPDDLLMRKKR